MTLRTCLLVASLGAVWLFRSPSAIAGDNTHAKIVIHIASPTTKNGCVPIGGVPGCEAIVTSGDLYPQSHFAYVLVTDADPTAGIAGVQFGIDYEAKETEGVDINDWTACGTLEFPEPGWPDARTGDLVTWDSGLSCQQTEYGGPGTGVIAVAGYFYLTSYSADTLRVTPRPADVTASVADCSANVSVLESATWTPSPSPLGYAVFSAEGSLAGYNPCLEQGLTELWALEVTWDSTGAESGALVKSARVRLNTLSSAPEDTFPVSTLLLQNKVVLKEGEAYYQRRYVVPLDVRNDGTVEGSSSQAILSRDVTVTRDGTLVSTRVEPGLPGRVRTIPRPESIGSGSAPVRRHVSPAYFDLHVSPPGDLAVFRASRATYLYDVERGLASTLPYKCGVPTFGADAICMIQLDNVSGNTRVAVLDPAGRVRWNSRWLQQPEFVNDAYLFPDGASLYFSIDRQRTYYAQVAEGAAEQAISLPSGTGRWFSQDGKSLLVRTHESASDVLSLWSLEQPVQPEMLWQRTCESGRYVTNAALSQSGSYVVYKLQQSSGVLRDVHVVDRRGVDIAVVSRTKHNDDGLMFVSDSDFFDGYDPANTYGRSSTIILYRIDKN